jgi:hypothetical protein
MKTSVRDEAGGLVGCVLGVHMGSRPVSRSPGASELVTGERFGHLRDLLLLGFDDRGDTRIARRVLGDHAGGAEMDRRTP